MTRLFSTSIEEIQNLCAAYTTQNIQSYPNLANFINALSAAAAWTYGAWVQIVPTNTITNNFIIVGIAAYASTTLDAMIELGIGAAGAEAAIMDIATHLTGAGEGTSPYFFPTPRIVAANSRVAVRFTDGLAAANTLATKIMYVELPL